jgi:hypothetical protein
MSRWAHDAADCPPDPDDADPDEEEPRTVQNLAARLQRDLPGDWQVTEYVYMDPRKKNHAGASVLEALTVEHPDGVILTASPYSSFPSDHGPTLYNGHILSRQFEGDREQELRRGADEGGLGSITGIHEAVVEQAQEHVDRRGRWFHSDDTGGESTDEAAAVEEVA